MQNVSYSCKTGIRDELEEVPPMLELLNYLSTLKLEPTQDAE